MFNNKQDKDKTPKELLADTLGKTIAEHPKSKTQRYFSKRVDTFQADRLKQIPNILNKLNYEATNDEAN